MNSTDRSARETASADGSSPADFQAPMFSVVLNSYNYAEYLEQAIESVLAQNYSDKELIIVDDGSQDGSLEIIAKYADRATIICRANQGQAKACLSVMHLCNGTHIQFLDSDDFLAPGALSRIAQECKPHVAKIQFQLTPVGPDGSTIGRPFPPVADFRRLSARDQINHCGYYATPPNSGNTYRADVFDLIEDIDYERSIDGIPYMLAAFLGEVVQINESLGFYRIHTRNDSGFSQHISDLSVLRPEKLLAEATRQANRLMHLQRIITDHKLPPLKLAVFGETPYSLERLMLGEVSDGAPPTWDLIARYCRIVARDLIPLPRKVGLITWALMLGFTPNQTRKRLALLRLNPHLRHRMLRKLGLR